MTLENLLLPVFESGMLSHGFLILIMIGLPLFGSFVIGAIWLYKRSKYAKPATPRQYKYSLAWEDAKVLLTAQNHQGHMEELFLGSPEESRTFLAGWKHGIAAAGHRYFTDTEFQWRRTQKVSFVDKALGIVYPSDGEVEALRDL